MRRTLSTLALFGTAFPKYMEISTSEVNMAVILILLFTFISLVAQDSLTAVPEWGDIEIESQLSTDSLAQNDTLVLTVRLRLRGNPDDYAIAEPGIPPVSNLSLVSTAQANKTERAEGGTELVKQYRYTFTPISIGMAYINPLRVQYVFVPNGESRSLSTNRLEVKITEPVIPPKGIDWVVILIVLIVVFAGAASAYVLSRRTQTKPLPEELPKPPEETARQRIANLKTIRESDIAKYIDSSARVLFNYIFERYNIDSAKLSQNELVSALENRGIPSSAARNIDRALGLCEQIRFAAQKATPDDRDTIELALEALLSYGEKVFLKEQSDNNETK